MIEQISTDIKFLAFYVVSATGVGATGLTVTVDVRSPLGTIITGASATEVGGGIYSYNQLAAGVTVEGEYTAVFKTADVTVSQKHILSICHVGRAGIENLDAPISGVSAGSITALMSHVIDVAATDGTVEQALLAALADGFGKWVRDNDKLLIYTPDGDDLVWTFKLTGPRNLPAVAREKDV